MGVFAWIDMMDRIWVLFGRVESLTLDPLSISPWEGEGDELAGEGKEVLADSYVLWVGRPRWGARPTDVGPSPCWWATTRSPVRLRFFEPSPRRLGSRVRQVG